MNSITSTPVTLASWPLGTTSSPTTRNAVIEKRTGLELGYSYTSLLGADWTVDEYDVESKLQKSMLLQSVNSDLSMRPVAEHKYGVRLAYCATDERLEKEV